ncbi:MAG TPA: nucleoside-diphosphate sugar epimerase/dehydratase [Steroidobacter sp.]
MPLRLLERCARSATRLPRATKSFIAFSADALAMPGLLFLAATLRYESLAAAKALPLALYAVAAAIGVFVFASIGLYRAVFRYISRIALYKAAIAVAIATALLAVANLAFGPSRAPHSSIVIFGALVLLYFGTSRALVRECLYFRRGKKERVVIYGAGEAGAQLCRSLRDSGQYVPVAFIDADPSLHGHLISGLRIYAPEALPKLIERRRVSSVLLAIPSCTRRQRQMILKSLEPLPVHVRTVPDISDIVAGHASVSDVREVDPSDLLGRDPVAPNQALLEACIRGKVVMVTGAGGSIGSELCRQIIALGPVRLLLVEMSEPALYHIDRELRTLAAAQHIKVDVVPLLGNAHHRNRVREIMHKYKVQTVYHAAAYKHVPIVEQNVIEGIHNNVFSTWHLAEAALECNVETFVLISTDKAVNPTNVMGATKRLAELTLQALQSRSTTTRFCMVRFGNVLESSGSVVPLFREQIKRGGPVTVTHRDVIRYFMTIPEASQLVLQASAMGQGGDVFVLDMGEPLRIEDLARRMIRLMGLTVRDEANPEGDIEIVYTGLRPAEKLYEELLIGGNVTGTDHPMIMRAMEPYLPWAQLQGVLAEMLEALNHFDCVCARDILMRTVAEYRPESGIQDLVWLQSQAEQAALATNVTPLRPHLSRKANPPRANIAS